MLILDRQQRVLNILRETGSASLEQLCGQLDVSVSTVRRDLDRLAAQGLVERTHGGAILLEPSTATPPSATQPHAGAGTAFAARMADQIAAKRAIGREVARLIEPNMTLIMDAGSTVVYAAEQITVRPIQIATTSLAIAQLFANDDQVEVTVAGGKLYPRTAAMVGQLTIAALDQLYADLCLMSLAAMDETAGYNLNLEQTRVEQTMMRQAERSVLLMDSGKFGRRSLVKVAPVAEFDHIITDAAIDPVWLDRFAERLTVASA